MAAERLKEFGNTVLKLAVAGVLLLAGIDLFISPEVHALCAETSTAVMNVIS